jgi:hypothetical protein
MLSLPSHIAYLHEPFNPVYKASGYGIQPSFWYQYAQDGYPSLYREKLEKLLKFRAVPFTDSRFQKLADFKIYLKRNYELLTYRWQCSRALVKDPLALFSAPWLVREFDMQPVILVRHPAAFVHSVTKQGWRFDFQQLLDQPQLMRDRLLAFRDQMADAAGLNWSAVAEATLLWQVTHTVIQQYEDTQPGWLFVRHEDLSSDPVAEFRKLYETLGIPFNGHVQEVIGKYSGGRMNPQPKNPVNDIQRDSRSLIDKWRYSLPESDQAYILKHSFPIAKRWYREELAADGYQVED